MVTKAYRESGDSSNSSNSFDQTTFVNQKKKFTKKLFLPKNFFTNNFSPKTLLKLFFLFTIFFFFINKIFKIN